MEQRFKCGSTSGEVTPAQRWITYRRRSAVGDLFLGPYPALIAA